MRNTKKFLAAVMAAAMMLGLTACGNNNSASSASNSASTPASQATSASASASKAEEPKAPLKITVNLPSNALHDEADPNYDKLVQYINEYTNMDITWEWEDDKDKEVGYYAVLATKFAANDFRDVMRVGNDALFRSVAKDYFWDVTDYIDDYDNLRTIPSVTRANCSIEGRMYGIPLSRTLARNGFGYRQDWCDKLGIDAPKTWDEFYEMCYKFTYEDPDGNHEQDTYGIILDSWNDVWPIITVWFGAPNKWGLDSKGDLIPDFMTDEWRAAMKELRKMYEEGLINTDFMEVDPGKARNVLQDQKGGVGFQVLDTLRKIETYFEGADVGLSDPEEPIFMLGGYLTTESGKGQAYCLPTDGFNGMVAISKKNITTEDQLKQVLGFLNDMCDGEMMNAVDYGFEGITWDKDENGYIKMKTAEELEAAGTSATFRNGFNQCIAYFTAPENARTIDKAPADTVITKLEQQLYADDIQYCVPNYGAGFTSATYDAKGQELDALIKGGADGAIVKYIKGEIDDAGLDEIINTWKTAGGNDVIKEMNEAYHASGK